MMTDILMLMDAKALIIVTGMSYAEGDIKEKFLFISSKTKFVSLHDAYLFVYNTT